MKTRHIPFACVVVIATGVRCGSAAEEEASAPTSIIFNTVSRGNFAFDIYSLPIHHHKQQPLTLTPHRQLQHTDGYSVNSNGHFVSNTCAFQHSSLQSVTQGPDPGPLPLLNTNSMKDRPRPIRLPFKPPQISTCFSLTTELTESNSLIMEAGPLGSTTALFTSRVGYHKCRGEPHSQLLLQNTQSPVPRLSLC